MIRKYPLKWPLANASASWAAYAAVTLPLALFAGRFMYLAVDDRNGWYALVGGLIGYLAWHTGTQAVLWWQDRK